MHHEPIVFAILPRYYLCNGKRCQTCGGQLSAHRAGNIGIDHAHAGSSFQRRRLSTIGRGLAHRSHGRSGHGKPYHHSFASLRWVCQRHLQHQPAPGRDLHYFSYQSSPSQYRRCRTGCGYDQCARHRSPRHLQRDFRRAGHIRFPSHTFTIAITVPSAAGDDFQLASGQAFPAAVDAGSQTTAKISITSRYSGSVTTSCDATALSAQCSLTPGSPLPISAGTVATQTVPLNIPSSAAPQPSSSYNIKLTVADSSGQPTQTLVLPLTVIQDFNIGSLTPPTQTITSGQSSSYNFSVLPIGTSFAGTISLSCSGGPTVSLCSFTPNTVTPGNNSAAVVMKISTTSSSASLFPKNLFPKKPGTPATFYALWIVLPALSLLGIKSRGIWRSTTLPVFSLLGLFLLALLLVSCGGGGTNGGGTGGGGGGGGGSQQQGTQPGSYTITVTGTWGALTHQAPSTVSLIVNAQ